MFTTYLCGLKRDVVIMYFSIMGNPFQTYYERLTQEKSSTAKLSAKTITAELLCLPNL